MSQFGANEFAKSGWNYREILLHYFPGVQMQKMDGCYPETLEVNGQQVDTKVVLARILEKEMGGSYHLEALKAQAVAAYTYILRQNRVDRGCDRQHLFRACHAGGGRSARRIYDL